MKSWRWRWPAAFFTTTASSSGVWNEWCESQTRGFVTAGVGAAAPGEPGETVLTTKKDYRHQPFTKFVALGESTTAGGWSTSPERCWVPRLAALIDDFQERPLEVFNAGIGANVISRRSPAYETSGKPAADERLQKHVIDQAPDLLVISYGLNDARCGISWSFFRSVMLSLIRRVRAKLDPRNRLAGTVLHVGFRNRLGRWIR